MKKWVWIIKKYKSSELYYNFKPRNYQWFFHKWLMKMCVLYVKTSWVCWVTCYSPSSLWQCFSMAATHDAHVMPVMCNIHFFRLSSRTVTFFSTFFPLFGRLSENRTELKFKSSIKVSWLFYWTFKTLFWYIRAEGGSNSITTFILILGHRIFSLWQTNSKMFHSKINMKSFIFDLNRLESLK